MRILIVEDNAGVRGLIRRALAGLGAEFVECGDGAEAVAAYAAEGPDFVLMDIEMPAMDGITATRQIIAADPSARIIILTNHDQPSLREAARVAGACGYVLKENLFAIRELIGEQTAPPGPEQNTG
jgi:two-component system chemotaxis response regulator CheY